MFAGVLLSRADGCSSHNHTDHFEKDTRLAPAEISKTAITPVRPLCLFSGGPAESPSSAPRLAGA